ncbi:membrane protein [Arthrobacter phage Kardesai]|uniref:PnuC-like nicotinamide riboside transporter n=1 Tax=Arthrobacter phage Kardesai TaxID=2859474 RepID=A0AAE7VHK9_9CAUD|nr:membrane protein [Arthrobacter phage Kardesai]QXO12998.1 PnuC-like nicotinamide riboside transporter [Arthrobacter phage Kardesai]
MDSAQVWSWIVTIVGVIGWYFVGKKYWWSWFIGLFCQILWFVYATVSQQPAFYISVLLYGTIYGKNAYQWTKEHFKQREENEAKV